MSMTGALKFFLRIQIKQGSERAFLLLSKYTKELLKKCDIDNAEMYSTPMSTCIELNKKVDEIM